MFLTSNGALNVKGNLDLSENDSVFTNKGTSQQTGDAIFHNSISGSNISGGFLFATGGIGIGLPRPSVGGQTILNVAGDVIFQGTLASNTIDSAGGDGYTVENKPFAQFDSLLKLGDHDGSNFATALFSNGGTEAIRITGGNVGIGTTSPANKLHVDATTSSNVAARFNTDSTYTFIDFYNDDTNRVQVGNASDGDFIIRTSDTERMRIDSGGNVGIGTTNPSAKLEVNGHFAATTKSFIIDNLEKGDRLQYGVVETDEHGVYVRGKSDQEEVELPEEWNWLVHEDSVTVQLTSVGQIQQLFVVEQNNKKIKIGGLVNGGQYNYVVYGTRKDVDPLEKHLK
jgi:hypothetical protein